jgi:hypothetical protein
MLIFAVACIVAILTVAAIIGFWVHFAGWIV